MSLAWLRACEDTIAEAVQREPRVALLYSGGLESSLLLRLAEPWRDRVRVYTVRTGAEFPHMVVFTDRALASWEHRVIRGDLGSSFRDFGIPASVLPIEHVPGFAASLDAEERLPRIVPHPMCCARNRAQPGYEGIKADGLSIAIHGQRGGDYSKGAPAPLGYPGLTLVGPLWDVSREHVLEAVKVLGVELPDHYAEYASSLDCAVCPVALTSPRRAWMSRHYPEPLAVAEKLQAEVRTAVLAALDPDNTTNARVIR